MVMVIGTHDISCFFIFVINLNAVVDFSVRRIQTEVRQNVLQDFGRQLRGRRALVVQFFVMHFVDNNVDDNLGILGRNAADERNDVTPATPSPPRSPAATRSGAPTSSSI